jgi:adenylosuccinate lyase
LLLMLIDKGLSRELAYDTVQPLAMKAWEQKRPFQELVENDPEVQKNLSSEEIESAFDYAHHTRNVDRIFKRAGLG